MELYLALEAFMVATAAVKVAASVYKLVQELRKLGKDVRAEAAEACKTVAAAHSELAEYQRRYTGEVASAFLRSMSETMTEMEAELRRALSLGRLDKILKSKAIQERLKELDSTLARQMEDFRRCYKVNLGTADCSRYVDDLSARVFWCSFIGRTRSEERVASVAEKLESQVDNCVRAAAAATHARLPEPLSPLHFQWLQRALAGENTDHLGFDVERTISVFSFNQFMNMFGPVPCLFETLRELHACAAFQPAWPLKTAHDALKQCVLGTYLITFELSAHGTSSSLVASWLARDGVHSAPIRRVPDHEKWIAELVTPDGTKHQAPRLSDLLHHFKSIFVHPFTHERPPYKWFHDVTGEHAVTMLRSAPDGTFLLRPSATPGAFALTFRHCGATKNQRVLCVRPDPQSSDGLTVVSPGAPPPHMLVCNDFAVLFCLEAERTRSHFATLSQLIAALSSLSHPLLPTGRT